MVLEINGWIVAHGGVAGEEKDELRERLYFLDGLQVDATIAHGNSKVAQEKGLTEYYNKKTRQISYRSYRTGRFTSLKAAPYLIGPEQLPQIEESVKEEPKEEPLTQMEEPTEEENE